MAGKLELWALYSDYAKHIVSCLRRNQIYVLNQSTK